MAMTEQQEKWFASVAAGLEKDTGRSVAEWVRIAEACPEAKHRARLQWFKSVHGLGQNRASIVLAHAERRGPACSDADALLDALWIDPASRAIYEAVAARVQALPEVVIGERKGFVGFSRRVQFAAIKPIKGGEALLGLDLEPDAGPRLAPTKREGWSERLKSALALASAAEVNAALDGLLRRAWERAG